MVGRQFAGKLDFQEGKPAFHHPGCSSAALAVFIPEKALTRILLSDLRTRGNLFLKEHNEDTNSQGCRVEVGVLEFSKNLLQRPFGKCSGRASP